MIIEEQQAELKKKLQEDKQREIRREKRNLEVKTKIEKYQMER